ncbi:MAG: hypothetical protein ACXIUV_00940 [Alkalilacustris sp.]
MTRAFAPRILFRPTLTALALLVLAACNTARDLEAPVEPIGDFFFGHNIVVAENAQRGPLSRAAEPEEWEEALRTEMERRFRRFDGDRLYHLAIGVEGYILAVPGVPLVASPRSALIFSVTVWDDAGGGRINDPHRITVFEGITGGTLVGSGLTRSREEQMQDLAQNAANAIEFWMRENSAWFEPVDPDDPEAVAARTRARATSAEAIRDAQEALLR